METLIQIGETSLDAIHVGAIFLSLALAGGLAFVWSQKSQLIESHERLQEEYGDLEGDIAQLQQSVETQRAAAEDARLDVARLQARSAEDEKKFASLANDIMNKTNQQFMQLAEQTFEKHREGARGELKQLMQPIGENFDAFKKRVEAIEEVRTKDKSVIQEQVKAIGESLHRNTAETGKLVNALTAPKGGGRWGEMQLRNVMEIAGLSSHCDFNEQVNDETEEGRQRPDAVINLPGGRQIVVDSKVSLVSYMSAVEEPDPVQKTVHLKAHATSVQRHVDTLASKRYQANLEERVDFVAMFIPGENFFAAALEYAPDLLERAYSKNVIVTTPSTLIGLAKTVAYVWRQEKMAENAREAARLGQQLYERISILAGHIDKLGKSLNGAVDNYNKLNSSLDKRVLPTMRKFEELSIAPPDKLMAQPKKVEARADASDRTLLLDFGKTDEEAA